MMLAYHAHPGTEETQSLLRASDQAANLTDHPLVGPLLRHVQVYYQQRRQMDEVIAAYAKGGLALESRDDYGDWSTLVVRRA